MHVDDHQTVLSNMLGDPPRESYDFIFFSWRASIISQAFFDQVKSGFQNWWQNYFIAESYSKLELFCQWISSLL